MYSRIEREFLEIDGPHISVADLKKSLIRLKGIGKKGGVDLKITNDQTKEVYTDENTLIAEYSMVKVAIVPAEKRKERPQYWTQARAKDRKEEAPSTPHNDLASLDIPEQEKIQVMMIQPTLDYHPSKYVDIRHSKQTGPVLPHFRCHRCQQRGSHWIYNCPLGLEGKRVKRSTGIPRSFMNTVEGHDDFGWHICSSGSCRVIGRPDAYDGVSRDAASFYARLNDERERDPDQGG